MRWELAAIFCALMVQTLAATERVSSSSSALRMVLGLVFLVAGGVFMVVGLVA